MPKRMKQQRVKKQRVPKPVKIARPKIRDLRVILKGAITVSLQNRIATLGYALAWYDGAIPYLLQKGLLAPDARKKLELAVKARKQGMGTNQDHEKESAFLLAVRLYEKACAALKPLAVDKFYEKLAARKQALEKKQERMEQKFGNVVGLLQKAIGDRIQLEVADAQKPVQYSPSLMSLSYNRDATKQMAEQFRKEGFLPVFVNQLDVLARHAALQPDGQGGWSYDPERQVKITEELLKAFVEFTRTADAPKKLVKSGLARVLKPRTGGIARAPRGSTKGPRYLGFLVPGTAIGTVYERLMDEQEHELKKVIEGLATGDPVGRVKQLGRYGAQKGKYTVTINAGKVQLKHAAGVTPGEKA